MDLNQISDLFTGQNILNTFFKAFALFFAFFYLFYAVIISRQTTTMNQTLRVKSSPIISLISLLQIGFALILIILALFFV